MKHTQKGVEECCHLAQRGFIGRLSVSGLDQPDGVRMGLMLAAPAGNDIMYDDKLVEQGRNLGFSPTYSYPAIIIRATQKNMMSGPVTSVAVG